VELVEVEAVTFLTTRPPERVPTPSAPMVRVPRRWSRIVP
jgi:hypothetical protein